MGRLNGQSTNVGLSSKSENDSMIYTVLFRWRGWAHSQELYAAANPLEACEIITRNFPGAEIVKVITLRFK